MQLFMRHRPGIRWLPWRQRTVAG